MEERLGQVLVETYRLDRVVAEGGMASVYEASHLRVPKRFAVKFLKTALVENSEALQRFRREAEIIAGLDHPSIVQLIDYNVTEDGTPYIVLEFLDGETLGARLERGPLEPQQALRITQQVASALQTAHARDIVHRDLKPENIMLCRGGAVKVLDFGVAKLKYGPELTAFNVVVGTVGFMSPEQVSGGAIDARTDQFTLAGIVYYMLSGKPAFELPGAGITQQALHILHHRPPDLPALPAALNAVLQKAMSKAPADRFDSVQELATALLAAAGMLAPAPPPEELAPLTGLPTAITAGHEPAREGPPTDPEGIVVEPEMTMTGAPTANIPRPDVKRQDPHRTLEMAPALDADTDPGEPEEPTTRTTEGPALDLAATLPPDGSVTPSVLAQRAAASPRPGRAVVPPVTAQAAELGPPLADRPTLPPSPDRAPAAPARRPAAAPASLDTTAESHLPRGPLGRLAWVGIGVAAGGVGAALIWWIVR